MIWAIADPKQYIASKIKFFYLFREMHNHGTLIFKLQDGFVKRHGIKLGFMSAFVKASAYALQQLPVVNAVIDGQEIVYRDFVDISVAVATPKV